MNCRRAQVQIALWLGDGLGAKDETELRGHLTGCPCCREHLAKLQSTLACLHAAECGDADGASKRSLWPGLATRLPRRSCAAGSAKFFGGTAMLAVAVAWILVSVAIFWNFRNNRPASFVGNGPSARASSSLRAPLLPKWAARSAVPQVPAQSHVFPGWPPPRQNEVFGPSIAFPFRIEIQGRCPHCGQPVIGGLHLRPSESK